MSAPNSDWKQPRSPAVLTPTGDAVVRVIAGVIAVGALPFVFPRPLWRRAVAIGAAVFCGALAVVVAVGQIVG